MKRKNIKSGFTMIEVTLVLAVSALMLVGIMAGTASSIASQRYNDAVQGITDFLQRAYSDTINVENDRVETVGNRTYCVFSDVMNLGTGLLSSNWVELDASAPSAGRSNCAIYGKLITFGEGNSSTIYSYDVVGLIPGTYADLVNNQSDPIYALRNAQADVVTIKVTNEGGFPSCSFVPSDNVSQHTPLWDAFLEYPKEDVPFTAAVLIARSPLSGTIHTYVLKNTDTAAAESTGQTYSTVNIRQLLDGDYGLNNASGSCSGSRLDAYYNAKNNNLLLSSYLEKIGQPGATAEFVKEEVNICVNSDDRNSLGGRRRNIRIVADGRNASAVELIPQDTEDNKCL